MVVECFSGSDKTVKVAKNYFKLLHQKGFYSANVPEVTQKLALMTLLFLGNDSLKL